jgi:hypothetical protein
MVVEIEEQASEVAEFVFYLTRQRGRAMKV